MHELTVFWFQIPMQNHGPPVAVPHGFGVGAKTHDILTSWRRVLPIVTAVESIHNLGEYGPDKFLLGKLVLVLEILDDATEVAVATVFHVEMQILRGLEMFALVVADDVGMDELLEDGQLGLELFFFLLGHFGVGYFLAAENLHAQLARGGRRGAATRT